MNLRRPLLWLSLLLLAACVEESTIRPDFLLADAHGSGSRVAVDEQGRRVASAGLDGTLGLWEGESGRRLARWKGHEGSVNGLLFLAGGTRLVSGAWDGRVALWDSAGRRVADRHTASPVTAMVKTGEHAFWSGHADGSLRLWSSDLELREEQRLPAGYIRALAWSGGTLAAADRKGNLWLRRRGEEEFRRIDHLPAHLRALVFDDEGRHLFGGSWFRLYRWDLASGKRTMLDTDHFGIITALDWDPSRRLLFSISRQTDSSILALDPATGATRTDFGRHDLCGADVAISPDGSLLATTSDDGSVRIWRLASLLR